MYNDIFFKSIFYESAEADKIKEYKETEAKLKNMIKDGTMEKIHRFERQYARLLMYTDIAAGVIFPPFLLAALVEYHIADSHENKSKRGQLTKLKRSIDKDIKRYKKDMDRYNDKEKANIRKNIDELQKISDRLAIEIKKENPHMPNNF